MCQNIQYMFSGTITTRPYSAPCGDLLLGSFGDTLCLCDWLAEPHHTRVTARLQRHLRATIHEGDSPTLRQAAAELDKYFAGKRRHFTLPLLLTGTNFQKKVWQELLCIPYGSTLTYSEQARHLGMPTATRAIASANGANALSIVVPCHRVIGSRGSLTGYAGGLEAKLSLLQLEQTALRFGPASPHTHQTAPAMKQNA